MQLPLSPPNHGFMPVTGAGRATALGEPELSSEQAAWAEPEASQSRSQFPSLRLGGPVWVWVCSRAAN